MIWFFGGFFIIGVVGSAVIVARKIPLVLSTPRQVVDDYFQQETARIHIRALRVKSWFQKGEYWDPILFGLLRFLRALRIGILKLERYTFVLTQRVNELYEARKTNGNGKHATPEEPSESAPKFWSELRERTTDSDNNLPT